MLITFLRRRTQYHLFLVPKDYLYRVFKFFNLARTYKQNEKY